MTPTVTVLMAVYNGEEFLEKACESIVAQTYPGWECCIVDDGSSDGSADILATFGARDDRFKITRNASNLGLTASLNVGLRLARGQYVARLDADDMAAPDRIERQLAFLEGHGDHVAVGSGYRLIDERDEVLRTVDSGLDDWQIRWFGAFNPPAPHPAYFFRRADAAGSIHLYDERFRTAQDFDFWDRLGETGKTRVLPEVLLSYRRHPGAITVAKRREQAQNCLVVGKRSVARRYPAPVAEAAGVLLDMFAYNVEATPETVAAAVSGMNGMLREDAPRVPSKAHRAWMRRTAAGILADAILSRGGGLRSAPAMSAFLYRAAAHLPWLARAVLSDPAAAKKSLRAFGRA